MYPTKKLWETWNIIRWVSYSKWDLLEKFQEWCVTLLRANNINNWLNTDELQFLPKELINSEKILQKNDIIFCMSSWSRDLVWKNTIIPKIENYSFGAFCSALRLNKDTNPYFISYFLQTTTYKNYIRNLWKWWNILNLRNSDLQNLPIPLPPLSTQKLIVDKLDMIFVEIEKSKNLLEKNLQNMDEMNKSVLEKVFANDEWERKKLGEVCENKKLDVWNVKTQNYLHKWKFPIIDQWKKFISWYSNDEGLVFQGNFPVLIYWDHTNIVKYIDFPFITWADGIKILYFSNKIDTKFIYYAILCLKPKNHWYRRHFPLLKQISIPLPPLSKQKEIVSYLDSVFAENQKLQNLYQAQIKNLDEMKQSFLKKAFAGELI